MNIEMDALDRIATEAFEGVVVRKDLVRRFKGQYPVPTYVAEFVLGRYCSSVDEQEIQEGLQIVERQLGEKTARAGEQELFKARAKELGQIKIIDIITARLDAGTDSFLATLPSLQLNTVRIAPEIVRANERMLTGGFYAEIELTYDPTIAQESKGRPFGIASLREIQISKRDVLDTLGRGREMFSLEEWKRFLLRSCGLEPEKMSARACDVVLLRMVSGAVPKCIFSAEMKMPLFRRSVGVSAVAAAGILKRWRRRANGSRTGDARSSRRTRTQAKKTEEDGSCLR